MWTVLMSLVAWGAAPDSSGERAALPAREVERSLWVPMGWTLVQGSAWSKRIRGAWSDQGRPIPADGDWRMSGSDLTVRHGWGGRMEWWLSADYRAQSRSGSGRPLQERGLVDPEMGVRWGLLEQEASGSWMAIDLFTQAAAGADGSPLDGPVPQLALSSGVSHLGSRLSLRQRVGALRFDGSLASSRAIPTLVGHVDSAPGRLDVGWTVRVDAEVWLQAGPLWAAGALDASHRSTARVEGVPVWEPRRRWSNAGVRGGIQVSRGARFGGGATWTMSGSGWAFPGVESLSPLRGVTAVGELEVAL